MFDRCLYFNTNALSRAVGKLWKQAYDELDLAPAHAYLLRLVLEKPGIVQREIAVELQLEKSTVTRFVDKMEDQGYLQRSPSPNGGLKEQSIHPTTQAKKIHHRLEEIGDELYAKAQQLLTKEKLAKLVSLERMAIDATK
ncbi:MAG: MarR family winged helix-turn-helix transcriptional regulator [Cellvibrionaceae bacterium]